MQNRTDARKWMVGLTLALAAALLMVGLAAAHNTTITKADPADGSTIAKSPAQVMVQFSEELDTKQSTMKVMDAAGKQVSDGNGKVDLNDANHKTMLATLPAALPDDVYTVQYHAMLTDGDATDGTLKFTVKAAAPVAADPTATIVPAAAPTVTTTMTATTTATTAMTTTTTPTTAVTTTAVTTKTTTPATLPTTGRNGAAIAWLLAGLAAISLVLGLTLRSRRA
jgi:copper resistance protein C